MAANGTSSHSLVVDTAGHVRNAARSSLERLDVIVAPALAVPQELGNIMHLKVVGEWISKSNGGPPINGISRSRAESRASDSDTHFNTLDSNEERNEFEIKAEKEWAQGIKTMRRLFEKLQNLEKLE